MVKSKKTVIKIEISDLCKQSSPCQHYVTLYYDDNTTEHVVLNSRQIYDNYKHLITDENELKHYAYVKVVKPKLCLKTRIKYRLINMIECCFNCC